MGDDLAESDVEYPRRGTRGHSCGDLGGGRRRVVGDCADRISRRGIACQIGNCIRRERDGDIDACGGEDGEAARQSVERTIQSDLGIRHCRYIGDGDTDEVQMISDDQRVALGEGPLVRWSTMRDHLGPAGDDCSSQGQRAGRLDGERSGSRVRLIQSAIGELEFGQVEIQQGLGGGDREDQRMKLLCGGSVGDGDAGGDTIDDHGAGGAQRASTARCWECQCGEAVEPRVAKDERCVVEVIQIGGTVAVSHIVGEG